MSVLLDELIARRKAAAIDYETYLNEVIAVARQTAQPPTNQDQATIKTRRQRAIFDNFDKNEELAIAIDQAIRQTARNG